MANLLERINTVRIDKSGLILYRRLYLPDQNLFMKKILTLVLAIIVFAGINSLKAQKAKWNEMEEFHKVMAQTFHPAEEGKLEPIKTRSGEMLNKAVSWKNSTPPAGYDKNAVKKSLKELVKGTKELDKMVKDKAPDASLTEKLSALHDVFHEIMEKCEKE